MPLPDNVPWPIRTAITTMEAVVQENKRSMAYCAPEMMDQFWIRMQMDLAEAMVALYEVFTEFTPSRKIDLEKAIAAALKESAEVAGEGFILRLAAIAADATEQYLKEVTDEPREDDSGGDVQS